MLYIFLMGQIIIDLPGKINRRYLLENAASAEILVDQLEQSAKRVKINPAARAAEKKSARLTVEDEADVRAARRARKGDLVSWEEVKKTLGLS